MQETWTLDFGKIESTESGLKLLLEKNEKDLGIFLSYYYKKEGAVAEKVKLKIGPEYTSEKSGSMILYFDLVHFNACLAIHEQKREEIKIEFEINSHENQLKLIGPYWPTREMDEI
jgi:hypothetical protein